MAQKEADVVPTIPLAPADLARAYADIAFGYHSSLPALHAKLDNVQGETAETRGIAIAAHGLCGTHAEALKRLEARVEDIALATKAKRTLSSGQMAAVSAPPSPPLQIRTSPSPTGSNFVIDSEELEKLKDKFAEEAAEKRGAQAALAQMYEEQERKEKATKAFRDQLKFYLTLAAALAATVTWILANVSFHAPVIVH